MDDQDRVIIKLTFQGSNGYCYNCVYDPKNPVDEHYLTKLIKYTKTNESNNLSGKFVRIVCNDYKLCGFGDLINDRFVPTFNREIMEVTEAAFANLLKTD